MHPDIKQEAIKAAVALRMELETVERAIIAARGVVTVKEMERRAQELNQQIEEMNQDERNPL